MEKLFDLNLKIDKTASGIEPKIGSVVLCTPGSCACENGQTLKSACCSVELTIYNCTK